MDQASLVAITIVNYNGYALTRDCLRSLAQITYKNHVLIVVDNASGDNSVQRLREEFPAVHYIQNLYNMGFTGGNNIGLKKAKQLGAEYVFFLNNDTIVSENILDELTTFVSGNPDVGLVGPLTYYYEARNIISFGGGYINRNTGIYVQYNKGKTLDQLESQVIYCNFVAGAALFLSTALADAMGGFSNVYFLTSEESELCVRVADKGYKLAVITSCSVWHKVSQTLTVGSSIRAYFLFRNTLLFVKRNAVRFGARDLIELVWSYGKSFAWYVLKGRDFSGAKALFLGTLDFFKGTTGAGRYAEKLNARSDTVSFP
jgi:hypothetical protein